MVSAGPAARVAVLTAPEQAPLDTSAHTIAPTVDEAAPIHAGRPNVFVAPTALPLFVRHCALLI